MENNEAEQVPDYVLALQERAAATDEALGRIEGLIGSLASSQQSQKTFIPGTAIEAPSNWDDMTYDEQFQYAMSARDEASKKERQEVSNEFLTRMRPLAESHLLSQVGNDLQDDEIAAARGILAETVKQNPDFIHNPQAAQMLRLLAIGAAEDARRGRSVKDGVGEAQPATADTIREFVKQQYGESFAESMTDEELVSIYGSN